MKLGVLGVILATIASSDLCYRKC